MARDILQKLEKPPIMGGALGFLLNCSEEERMEKNCTLGRKMLVHSVKTKTARL